MPTHGHAVATVNGNTVAETDVYEVVEGNVYFPPGSIKSEYFSKTDHSTHCPWKGDARYYTITVGGTQMTPIPRAGEACLLMDHGEIYRR